jgi:hypothetical protein
MPGKNTPAPEHDPHAEEDAEVFAVAGGAPILPPAPAFPPES